MRHCGFFITERKKIKVAGSFLSSAGLPCVVNLGKILGQGNV